MLGHAIVLIAIQVTFEAIKTSSALQIRGLSSLIEQLQRNEEKYNNARVDRAHVHDNKRYVAISSQELDQLIDQVANDVYNDDRNTYNDRIRNRKGSVKYDLGNLQNRNFEQFGSSNSQRGKFRPNKSVWYNREENSIDVDLENGLGFNVDDDDKLYLVLNPRANLNEKDFNNINALLSQILTGSATKNYPKQDNTRIKKEHRYKGFVLADGRRARRPKRESKELYSQPNSLEDFKPKRVRSDYGGAGGRTPIPYIRHRDIYERE